MRGLEAAHAAHLVCAWHASCACRLWLVSNDSLSGQEQSCNGCSVLECGAGDLNWVVDARSHEVDVLAVCSVEALALWELGNLVSNNAWLEASVSSDLLQRSSQSLADDANAGCLVAGKLKIVVQDVSSLQQRNATA